MSCDGKAVALGVCSRWSFSRRRTGMGLSYKVRQLGEKIIPLSLASALLFGGWHLYKTGTFRYGIKPVLTAAVSHIPYFGSRFRHYIHSNGRSSYVASKASVRKGKRHHGRGKHRSHSRRRRHR